MPPLLAALLLVAIPLALGAGLGLAVARMWRRDLPQFFGASALVVLPAASLALVRLRLLGVWDLILCGLLAGAAFWAASRPRAQRWAFVGPTLAGVATLALLEIATRLWGPEPPRFPPAREAHALFTPELWEYGCSKIYVDDVFPGTSTFADARHAPPRGVWHLGDSMVFGSGVGRDETFTALLEGMDAGTPHWNLGSPGTSLDVQLLLLRRWLPVQKPSRVVLHVFVGNDVVEMDRAYACCEDGALLSYDGAPHARCERPRWTYPLRKMIARSPPPLALRVATEASVLATFTSEALQRLSQNLEPPLGLQTEGTAGTDEQWSHLEATLRAIRDDLAAAGVPLVVSILPMRPDLEKPDSHQTVGWATRAHVLQIAEALQIKALDAWPLFEDVVQRDGARAWFVTPPAWDVHFAAAGHRRYARWLFEELGPNSPEKTASPR